MSDNEIIKALEICATGSCAGCPANKRNANCLTSLTENALDLINRQKAERNRLNNELHGKVEYIHEQRDVIDEKKSEIERLRAKVEKRTNEKLELGMFYTQKLKATKSEAIKEFAERLKDKSQAETYYDNRLEKPIKTYRITDDDIDNLVKEMVGEQE